MEAFLADASDFDVHFDGGLPGSSSTYLPSLFFRRSGSVENIADDSWLLVDNHGNTAYFPGSRRELELIVVEARRLVDAWRLERRPRR